jgi:hypothetical protein
MTKTRGIAVAGHAGVVERPPSLMTQPISAEVPDAARAPVRHISSIIDLTRQGRWLRTMA